MAMISENRGFALLIAVIFMSVMLSFGLALGALAYKQQVLSSTAIESQYAFYAADAALECALYHDQQEGLFSYASAAVTAPQFSCDTGYNSSATSNYPPATTYWKLTYRVPLASNTRCADVTIYKPDPNNAPSWGNVTYIFSQGYDVKCTDVGSGKRFASRGLQIHY